MLLENYTSESVDSKTTVVGLIKKTCIPHTSLVAYNVRLENGNLTFEFDDYSSDEFLENL